MNQNNINGPLEIIRQSLGESLVYKVATVAAAIMLAIGGLMAFGVVSPDTDGIGYLMMALSIIMQWGNANNPNVRGSYSVTPNPTEPADKTE